MKKIILALSILILFPILSFAQKGKVTIQKVKDTISSTPVVQTEKYDKDILIKIKEGVEVTIIIDGKKYDSDVIDILDQDKISSAFILTKESALKKYNEPNVVMILTKKEKEKMAQQRNEKGAPDPIYIIDGKTVNRAQFTEYDVNDIESVNVLKDEESKKKYNTEVGVIMITTKKKTKKK